LDTENTLLDRINRKIRYKRKDNLTNHLKTYFLRDRVNFSGYCSNKNFALWRCSTHSGIFYAVVIGHTWNENGEQKIKLKSKINYAGLILGLVWISAFLFLPIIYHGSNKIIPSFIVGCCLSLLPVLSILIIYLTDRKKALAVVREMLKTV